MTQNPGFMVYQLGDPIDLIAGGSVTKRWYLII